MSQNTSPWQTLSSKIAYKTPHLEIQEDKVIQPDGSKGVYSMVKKLDAVFLIPQAKDGSIYLVREYRYPLGKEILNIPAGSIKPDQTPEEATHAELKEETALTAGKTEIIGEHYIAPGFSNIKHYVYLMSDLSGTPEVKNTDGDESIMEVVKVSQNELREMIKDGRIEGGSTLAALCIYFLKK